MNFLKEGFRYDPDAKYLLTRNGRDVGAVVKNSKGYDKQYVRVHWYKDGKQTSAYTHRVIWELVSGPIPDGMQIDHINGDGLDTDQKTCVWLQGPKTCTTMWLTKTKPLDFRKG